MPTLGFDIQNPEQVTHELEQASRRLRREATVPPSVIGLLQDLCEDIGQVAPGELEEIAPTDWMEIQSAALRTLTAIRHGEDERQQRRQIRLLLEELHFRIARLADHQPLSDDRPAKEVVRWLDSVWSVPQTAKGAMVGVSDRTWQRWASTEEATQPTGDDERRLRLIARAVADLRHLLTANGVWQWLQDSDPGLDDRAPLEVIKDGDPDGLGRLYSLISRARSGAAA